MAYFLRLFFDPTRDHRNLRPKKLETGRVDHYDLGFVQNVVMEQVIAEIEDIPDDQLSEYDERYILAEPVLPIGKGCKANPANARQLLATENGYVAFEKGRINVHKVLTIPRDIDFHTGNIVFVGDLGVKGAVRTGFEVKARNVLVKDVIEGASVEAQGSIVSETGLKGGKTGHLRAGKSIRLPFCENATIEAKEAVIIEGSSLHCDVFVSGRLTISGRLHGGEVTCKGQVFVGEQIGGVTGTSTSIQLGYDPFLLLRLSELDERQESIEERLSLITRNLSRHPDLEEEFAPRRDKLQKKLASILRQREKLVSSLESDQDFSDCMLICPGDIRPSVEISIGPARLKLDDFHRNVNFFLDGDEIRFSSPAQKMK